MDRGCVEQIGRPFDMYEQPNGRFSSTFLGKANVFEATRGQAGAFIEVQGCRLPTQDASTLGAIEYIIRPEKLEFAAADAAFLQGRVSARVFLGNHWLYQVQTALGMVQLTHANTGLPQSAEGEQVGLRWAPEHARLVPRREA
jgi:putative spermidine/putrescine transport system ATP-binding protein